MYGSPFIATMEIVHLIRKGGCMDSGKSGLVVVAAIVALIVGGGAGYAVGANMDMNDSTTTMSVSEDKPNSATKAADLRVTLNQLMRRHVTLSSVALKDIATSAPETDAAVASLDKNSVELSKAVGSVYGKDPQDSFLSLWRNHIGFFVDYTKAKVAGDQKKMDQAKADITGYTEEASSFFANANPNIDKAAMKKGLAVHGKQVFAIVDAYAAKDYTKAFDLEEDAYNHIGVAADTLAQAIVTQYPNKF